jgi:luciferase family oxidoreductase group 1
MPAQKSLQQTPFSILELALIREGKDAADAFDRAAKLAQHAETLGYKRFWLAEHHNMAGVGSSATAVLIGHIAGKTKSIRVGSGGIMLPNHSALMAAEQFGTLESLYPGRIDMGLGRAPGTDQTTAAALRRGRMESVHDFPEDINALLQYFSPGNSNARVRAIPGEGLNVPLYILGSSLFSAVLAAKLGLPYAFASHFAPREFLSSIKHYRENFQPSATLKEPYVISCINVIAADTNEEAQKLATSFYQMARGILTGKSNPLKPAIDSMDGAWSPEEEAAIQQMMSCTFIGDQKMLKADLDDFIAYTQVDELMITSNIYDTEARLRSVELIAGIFRI